MFQDLKKGIAAVFRGIGLFYRTPGVWMYAILPGALVLLSGLILLIGWSMVAMPYLLDILPDPELHTGVLRGAYRILRWISGTALFLGFLLVLAQLTGIVYEFFGNAFFFDPLLARIRKMQYGVGQKPMCFEQNLKCCFNGIAFSIVTLLLNLFLILLNLILPGIGLALQILLVGYRYGISYLFTAAYTDGEDAALLHRKIVRRRALLLGFGCTGFLLTAIPFLSMPLLPGLVTGGAILYEEELKSGSGSAFRQPTGRGRRAM